MVLEKIVDGGRKAVLAGLSLMMGSSVVNAQNPSVKTQFYNTIKDSPTSRLVADGETVYRLDVRVDSQPDPTHKIKSVIWKTYIPMWYNILDAELPDGTNCNGGPSNNPDDFFEGFDMRQFGDENCVSTVPGTDQGMWTLGSPNERTAQGAESGPINREGAVEYIYVTVSENAPLGPNNPAPIPNADVFNNISLSGLILDPIGAGLYTTSSNPRTLDAYPFIPAQQYEIFEDLGPFDRDKDADIDQDDFGKFKDCVSGAYIAHKPGCDWADSDSDGDVDQGDFGRFQRKYTGQLEE